MGYRLRTFGNADSYQTEDYLNAALQIYDWIENNRRDGEDGVYYRVNPGAAIEFTEHAVHGKYGLYSGSAGIGLYLLRLFEATGDSTYLQEAEQVAEELIRHTPGSEFYEEKFKTAMQSELKVTGWHTGVYTGPAGAGIFALELYRIKPLEKYKAFAVKLGEDILKAGRKVTLNKTEETAGFTLSGDTDVFSDGGFVLYFLSLYQTTKEERFLTAAREFAAYIYCTCCGTPGLVEFFTDAYEFTGDAKYLEYAKRSAARTIGDSTYSKEGRLFYGSWDRTDPKNIQTFTGLYTGAAGAGANLLRLYAHYTGKKLTPLWEYGYLNNQG